ncbi:3-hydroxyacyl-CoA dehydrogenase/enoyl-CoA hydratase family protein [Marinobacterium arenosum]|uniref:3-hydroxyacyl-CoA dehydrogenase/enoyl-CoA hydratase family protein n=1 Tax=Marinobacterium arenosum TaxID=2862496 RepID=UPI001C95041F|nr:3-hydroxyacyl-CoA dehydrogenase/enoyl-CoA hydratase family protein [Marinobacterium arenosum]MBY4675349.1 enoyl-CoA hydratase/isomerase family protein [Marinobacterium arenosum]
MNDLNRVKPIRTVAVIGAGVMGAGIAVQAANGGAEVLLLDIPPAGVAADAPAEQRNAIASGALARMLKAGPSGALMDASVAKRIRVGNTEDDLALLREADWIVEVVVERLDVKQDLYRRIAEVRAPDAIVSSNTSTIPLATLVEGIPQGLREHFVVTHFFNPPRYMRLLELVTSAETRPEVPERVQAFIDRCMGKTVIRCNDRPGFIANRLGVYWMQVALQEAIAQGLSVEDADAVMQVCGFPKTGIFGLWDLVGIDLMPEVTASLSRLLPADDPFQTYAGPVPVIEQMVRNGWYGRKGRVLQGFYRQRLDSDGRKLREVLDLNRLEYRAPQRSTLASAQLKPGQLGELVGCDDAGGRYAWRVLARVLDYASRLVPDVAAEIDSVDAAMRLGYNWRWGPFELMDRIGVAAFTDRLSAEGAEHSEFLQQAAGQPCYQDNQQLDHLGRYQRRTTVDGVIDWQQVVQRPAVRSFSRSVLRELDRDTWCLEFNSKVNALSNQLLDEIESALAEAIAADKALILYSDSGIFAAGADLKEFLAMTAEDGAIDRYICRGQALFASIRKAPVPVVAAVAGKALGGGLELIFHCHRIQAHAEAYLGLVETSVGIVPGWGGCRELLARCSERLGPEQVVEQAFTLLAGARVSGSALEARQLGILRELDGISMNRDRLLSDAVEQARRLRDTAERTDIDSPPALRAATPAITAEVGSYQQQLEQRLLKLLNQAAQPGWFDRFGDLERQCNLELLQNPASLHRMQALLETGRPLRN